jgi:hypothetical protein
MFALVGYVITGKFGTFDSNFAEQNFWLTIPLEFSYLIARGAAYPNLGLSCPCIVFRCVSLVPLILSRAGLSIFLRLHPRT